MSEMKRIEEAKEEALWWSEWAQDQELLSNPGNVLFLYENSEETVIFWG